MNRFFCRVILMLGCGLCAVAQAADTRADFIQLIGHDRVALAPQILPIATTNGLVEFHFTYSSDAAHRVPGILVKSPHWSGPRPVVIVLHGTGGAKEDELPRLRELAEKGFVAVAIDGRYHGERTKAGKGTAEYNDAIVRAWSGSGEHPFFYDTVWDVIRLVDYLQTRDDVDPSRIGLMGISKGGVETYLAAAADPRIAVAVPCIGMQSFHWALQHEDWQGRIGTIQDAFDRIAKSAGVAKPDSAFVQSFYDRVTPGIYSEFDGPQMIQLIAPRPLLLVNGDSDNHTPLPGVMECVSAAKVDYGADGAADHFAVRIEAKTGHNVTAESEKALMDWFVKWLKP